MILLPGYRRLAGLEQYGFHVRQLTLRTKDSQVIRALGVRNDDEHRARCLRKDLAANHLGELVLTANDVSVRREREGRGTERREHRPARQHHQDV